ncbi:MAG: alpha-L-fucosidase [Lentisphaerae bacterium RIFOXYC12_FULL_60_16]|nr:MAG: alpha-L-fucosidase [Lentisphaerae bacterium RIFOXYC12_FULL_60_16]
MKAVPAHWQWFNQSRFGLFIHWGPYSVYGRGEQALNREFLDQNEYARTACDWNPKHYDPAVWASVAKNAGMKYAVLTTRHHDGYCLWNTKTTDYSSMQQAPKQDFVRTYVDACRAAGLKVGLYYSLIDFRLPAWFRGPEKDPTGWQQAKQYIFDQVRELLTQYGKIDVLWFDGIWPRPAADVDSKGLLSMIRSLQPDILVNDRLEWPQFSWYWQFENWKKRYPGEYLGDFGTPEQGIYADPDYLWESCQTAVSRLWGFTRGERWRSAEELLFTLVKCSCLGGNFILNVGPQPDGQFPPEFVERTAAIGEWLKVHGEAIYNSEPGDVTEFITYGWQTVKENNLYLIIRFWDNRPTLQLVGLKTKVKRATLLTTGQDLAIKQTDKELVLSGLPPERPTALYPVIRLECAAKPEPNEWGKCRTWRGDNEFLARWAESRGTSVWADGKPR